MDTNQRQAVLDLCAGRVDEGTFLERYGVARAQAEAEVARRLREALDQHDGELAELALLLGFRFSFPEGVVDLLNQLVRQDWHVCHDDAVQLLQRYRSPTSVLPLRDAIALKPRLSHLEHDDHGSFYKKCLWALHDIGTKEAIAVIEQCSKSEDAPLRKEADCRLRKMGRASAEHP